MSDDDKRRQLPTAPPPRVQKDPRRPQDRTALTPSREDVFARVARPRQMSRPAEEDRDWQIEVARIAAREAREVVQDLLEGLDQRIVDVVDGRMREWMDPVADRLSLMSDRMEAIASQQGADVQARLEHAAWVAEKRANEEAEKRVRSLEEAFRREREHFVNLSVGLTERRKTEEEAHHTEARTFEMPRELRSKQWSVAAKLLGAVALLLSALGASTVYSQCVGSSRAAPHAETKQEKVQP